MCGLAGLLTTPGGAALRPVAAAMADRLAHRGPDGAGAWSDEGAGIALGHRRLAILDLSPAGAQPMASASGRWVVAYNGEIYNHRALRDRLAAEGAAPVWRGHSDTETLLAALDAWGPEATLRAVVGMFAIAAWDRRDGALVLARDRLGEKPLFLARVRGGWAFASELRAFDGLPGHDDRVDPAAAADVLARGHVAGARTIRRGARRLPPAHLVRLRAADADPAPVPYWSLADAARAGAAARARPRDPEGEASGIEAVLEAAVGDQLLSDVPLGAFLSGGIDSSLVAALMRRAAAGPVRSYAIGFADAAFDEARHAEAVARHLGTDHATLRVTEADALRVVPDLPRVYDEPFADPSQIPTLLLCRLARAHVTVALTGDGGDEAFGGYNRHVLGPRLWARARGMPGPLRRGLGGTARLAHAWTAGEGRTVGRALRRAGLAPALVAKLDRLGDILGDARGIGDVHDRLVRHLADPGRLLLDAPADGPGPGPDLDPDLGLDDAEWMMAMDTLGYLPDDVLVKVDRAAMSASLETRAPFLDPRVVEAAWALPSGARAGDGIGKAVLRRVLARHVPPALTERPKQGFAIPLDRWLRGPLRDWAESLLSPAALAAGGLLDPAPARALWDGFLRGEPGRSGTAAWSLLMLQLWLRDREAATAPLAKAAG